MKHFSISIHTREEVQAFVKLAMVQPFDIFVGNSSQQVNGKNFMGMFSLDYRNPVQVQAKCDDATFEAFRLQISQLFAS